MIYNFSDMDKKEIYDSQILFICGNYSVFNNTVIDRTRKVSMDECLSKLVIDEKDNITLRDLDIQVDFNKFLEVSKVPSFVGKWYCSVNHSELSKAQLDKLEKYMTKPSKYARLVVEINDFREFKKYMNHKVVKNSKAVNLIKLSYPSKKMLKGFIESKLDGLKVSDTALDLFIMRMSDNYDEYENMISLVVNCGDDVISFDRMKELLKDVANYAVDDFILAIIRPPRGKRPQMKTIYKMMVTLKEDIGAYRLLNRVKLTVDTLILLRTYINNGYIPGRLKYSIKEFKSKLPEESAIGKMTDYTLKKYIEIALSTSIRDLFFMKMMLSRRTGYDSESCERVLIMLMNRAILSVDRLLCDIGVQNDINREITDIDSIALINEEVQTSESRWMTGSVLTLDGGQSLI